METRIPVWQEMQAAGFDFNSPFTLVLDNKQPFEAAQVVRIIPGKRMVAFGIYKGQQAVAKLFYDKRHAARHAAEDLSGIHLLQERNVPTPTLLFQGVSEDGNIHVLVFKRIMPSQSLNDFYQSSENNEVFFTVLNAVVIEIATQHVLGIVQRDLHLKNFLISGESRIYTLDGGQIESFSYLLPKKQSMENLALFLSQLGIGQEALQEHLFRTYAKARGWIFRQQDINDIMLMIRQWNDKRWKNYEAKINRNASDFLKIRKWGMRGIVNRHYLGKDFKSFLADPESVFLDPSVKMLKAGGSSTVIKVNLDNRGYVIKRYNMKNIKHRLRRCLRQTRAYHSWRLSQKMTFFGIRTAKPVAYIERHFLGLKGKSYFVMEYIDGQHAGEYLLHDQQSEAKLDKMIARITQLLKNLARLELTHGDLKITNILIDQDEQPLLIDLDGAAEHRSVDSLRKAWQKEIKRFLRNFDSDSALSKKFKAMLGSVDN